MSKSFDEHWADAAPHFIEAFGDRDESGTLTTATITEPDGTAKTGNIILGDETEELAYDDSGRENVMRREGSFRVSEVTEIKIGSAVVTGGFTYYVQSIPSRDKTWITAELVRRIDAAKHATDHVRRT